MAVKSPGVARALDCSRPAAALFWGAIGGALAVSALVVQGAPNMASVLRVGASNPLRMQIERELGPIDVTDPIGHDGQLYYLVARDPFASGPTVEALKAFDTPRYRYRRILFPALAGGFGRFSPRTTLLGMFALSVFGMALTAIGIADLAYKLKAPGESVFLAIINLGALVSTMLLTVDGLALGLSLVGMTLFLRQRTGWAIGTLALAVLTKETSVLVPLALAAWQWRERRRWLALALLVVPSLPLAVWSLWLRYHIPGIPEPGLLGWPIVGMASSLAGWLRAGELEGAQMVLAFHTAVAFTLSIATVIRSGSPILRWVAGFWLGLACFTGAGVWGIPTNVARAFSILWPLGVLSLFERRRASQLDGSR